MKDIIGKKLIVKEAVGLQRRLEGSDLVGDGETSGHAIASYVHLHYNVIVSYICIYITKDCIVSAFTLQRDCIVCAFKLQRDCIVHAFTLQRD